MPPPSNVSLLVGADTSIIDESSYARTLGIAGSISRTTLQSKFGGASIDFTAAIHALTTPNTSEFTFGSGDFTVEGWYRFQTRTSDQALMGQWGGSNSWYFYIDGNNLKFRINGGAVDVGNTWVPTLGQWYHLAAERSGTTLRVYIDGVVHAVNTSYSYTIATPTADLYLGAIPAFNQFDYRGQMDEIRITKGLAQYAGAFTPPTTKFSRGTSYTNPEGSGNRSSRVVVTGTASNHDLKNLVDGNTGDFSSWFNGSTNSFLEFWFPSKKIIDEAKFYQSDATSHGTWQWQGSNDRTTWTNIGGTFTLGGIATQTHTTLNGNTTAYIFYRVLNVAGSPSSGPFLFEFEFKIDEGGTTSYLNPRGSGNRTANITITSSGISWNGAGTDALVNGLFTFQIWWDSGANSGAWFTFDFVNNYIIQEIRLWASSIVDHGDWKIQGSLNNSSWTDLTGTFTISVKKVDSNNSIAHIDGLTANTTAYRYYRFLGISGNRSSSGYEFEFEFMVDPGPVVPNNANLSQLPVEIAVLDNTPVNARVSQLPVEIAILDTTPISTRISQLPIEVAILEGAAPGTESRITQLVTEVLLLPTPDLRISQLVTETLSLPTPSLRVSQLVTEIMTGAVVVTPSVEKVTFQIIA